MIPVLIGAVGLAVDMGNLYLSQSRLQAATDAAALAGSLELPYDPQLNNGAVEAAVLNMLHTNFPAATLERIASGSEVRSVEVRTQARVNTMLMHVLGIDEGVVEASAAAGFNHLEVVMVIDNSGSMRGTPINAVRHASTELVSLLMPPGAHPDTKVGLVPFRGMVRIADDVDGLPGGCRNADGSLNEGIREEYMDMYWELPSYLRRRVALDACSGVPVAQALTTDRGTIVSAINTQTCTGTSSGTVISEGIRWGTHMLTPEAPYDQAGSNEDYRKVMILLTDGDTEDGCCGGNYRATYEPNNYWNNAYYGMGDRNSHCNDNGALNQAMLDMAQAAKDAGIEIFVIRFGSSDAVDVELMRSVASSTPGTQDHYFDAPSTDDIDDIFKKIGRHLGWRLLS